MSNTRENLLNHVKSTVEQLEQAEGYADIEPLDITFRSMLVDGKIQLDNIILTVTTGGPKIDIDLSNNHVHGYWGKEEIHYPIFDKEEEAKWTIKLLWDHYSMTWDITQRNQPSPRKEVTNEK